jgi:hypothetical protein
MDKNAKSVFAGFFAGTDASTIRKAHLNRNSFSAWAVGGGENLA